MQNLNTTHEEDVTTSLRLNERAQSFALIPMFIFMVAGVSVIIAFSLGLSNVLLAIIIAVVSTALIIAAVPAIKAIKAALAFDKNHKAAYKDGQNYIKQQSFVDRSVFNNEAPLVKKLYGK
jgi:Na+/H+ antiporter NhaA